MMLEYTVEEEYKGLSKKEQNYHLFEKQKEVLDKLLERGALSKEQYQKALSAMECSNTVDMVSSNSSGCL